MLKVTDLQVKTGGKTILQDVSFALNEGEWLMLCGPNGAGKSTLVSAVSGLIRYDGKVQVMGKLLETMRIRERACKMAVLSQHTYLSADFTVEQVAAMGLYAHKGFWEPDRQNKARITEALRQVGMEEKRGQSILTLSGGEQQRVLLAQVFIQDPSILLLDEPANHLDLVYQKQIFTLIDAWRRQKGRAVLSVVHDLSLARRFGTHALLLNEGRCEAQGTIGEVLTDERLDQVYRMDVRGWLKELSETWMD